MLERSALFAVNHLLSHNPEAAALLGAHAGKCLRFRAPPLPDLLARIGEDGLLLTMCTRLRLDLFLSFPMLAKLAGLSAV